VTVSMTDASSALSFNQQLLRTCCPAGIHIGDFGNLLIHLSAILSNPVCEPLTASQSTHPGCYTTLRIAYRTSRPQRRGRTRRWRNWQTH
jgi:hypothetical protein